MQNEASVCRNARSCSKLIRVAVTTITCCRRNQRIQPYGVVCSDAAGCACCCKRYQPLAMRQAEDRRRGLAGECQGEWLRSQPCGRESAHVSGSREITVQQTVQIRDRSNRSTTCLCKSCLNKRLKVDPKGVEPSTSALRTQESSNASDAGKQLAPTHSIVCTRVCTSKADLEQVAADLRRRLSAGVAAAGRRWECSVGG